MAEGQSIDYRFVLIDMNMAHNLSSTYCLRKLYNAVRLRLACFVVCAAVYVGKVGECHRYIIYTYMKIVFSNDCHSKII